MPLPSLLSYFTRASTSHETDADSFAPSELLLSQLEEDSVEENVSSSSSRNLEGATSQRQDNPSSDEEPELDVSPRLSRETILAKIRANNRTSNNGSSSAKSRTISQIERLNRPQPVVNVESLREERNLVKRKRVNHLSSKSRKARRLRQRLFDRQQHQKNIRQRAVRQLRATQTHRKL